MNWANWDEFLAMGGYGLYVWGSVGGVFLALLLEWLQARLSQRALIQEIRQSV